MGTKAGKLLCCVAMLVAGYLAYPVAHALRARLEPPPYPFVYRHLAFCERSKAGGVKIVLLGDSIMDGWRDQPCWPQFEAAGVVDYGIVLDRADTLLWRIEHGTLDGCGARVVVLMIGTNDVAAGLPDERTVEGVRRCVAAVREKLPAAKVLVYGLMPRPDHDVGPLNSRIAAIADRCAVVYLPPPNVALADGVHPSPAGYRQWADDLLAAVR